MAGESIDQLQISKASRGSRLTVVREFLKKAIDVVRTERRHALAARRQIVIESRKHRAMLDDRLIGEATTICTGCLGSLPLPISALRIGQPKVDLHKNRYTEFI
ncbi:hypothetical protein [Caballeronia sp. INDeC2]|uniref:hypothetical protein n=1 Tax=Caballeronia sp. INDeC2 TaxID=2921747 RepID=UPI0020296F6B